MLIIPFSPQFCFGFSPSASTDSMERVSIFVDGSNFCHGLKSYAKKTGIDLFKLGQKLSGNRKLIRIYYYNVAIHQDDDPENYKRQQAFLDKIESTPYVDLRLGRLEARHAEDGSVYHIEKGVDINIAVDMLRYAYNDTYDTAILITGDGDFVSAVKAVQDLGKHVESAYFEAAKSHHLRRAADRFIPFSDEYLSGCFLE